MNIVKRKNHDHYFISDGILYESYNTLRGLRYMEIMNVAGMSDTDKCTESDLKNIEEAFLPKK